jgi:hypothetical protein|tara:strand:+ start:1397 stop:1702 length:306 start_codon:yes stop_codon:yes gene_type:complete
MKYGVSLKIDVSKIDKALLHKGAKGVYLDATVFIDPENPSQYGDHGMITQSVSKDANEKGAILGNAKVFWTGESQQNNQSSSNGQQSSPSSFDNLDEDIPF